MTQDEIIQYYDDLIRLATSRCHSQSDAEDLVGDTLLAAFAYLHRGGTIAHPKAWLSNTLLHKYNDHMRKKYRTPVTVCLDESVEIAEEEDEAYFTSEEASKVRKELNHLGCVTREVLIRFYFGQQSVADIAEGLGIPEGTDIPNELIAYLPKLEEFGLVGQAEGKPCLAIPVLTATEYAQLLAAIGEATEDMKRALGDELSAFVSGLKTPIPKHLTSVPELFRYGDATNYFVMAIIREAYGKGLHLQGVDYCCPPVVLVYEI